AGDTLVLNDSRVTARRLHAYRESGGEAELLLLRPAGDTDWEALIRPGRSLRSGARVTVPVAGGALITAEVIHTTPEGGRLLRFADRASRDRLVSEGEVPLPPYIREKLTDEERYQTVYSDSG